MVKLSPASIVIMPFPFSDLSSTKLRPALILTETSHDDWLLCQITSKAYNDSISIRLSDSEFARGPLITTSYARPMKLFTANARLIEKRVAIINQSTFGQILTMIIDALKEQLPSD